MASKKINHSGILVVNKPKACTSHTVVRAIRKIFDQKKVGHFGTLDPLATGVLVLGVGKGVALSQFMVGEEKEYHAIIQLGENRDTYDAEGVVVERFEVSENLEMADIERILENFKGKLMQVPPVYSAIKYDGKPLYRYARAGELVVPKAREITINKIKLQKFCRKNYTIELFINCSSGTYIRSIAFDIGKALGTGAYLKALCRVGVGSYGLSDSVSLGELKATSEPQKYLIPLVKAGRFHSYTVSNKVAKEIRNGLQPLVKELVPLHNSTELKSDCLLRVQSQEELVSIGMIEKKYLHNFNRFDWIYKSRRVFM